MNPSGRQHVRKRRQRTSCRWAAPASSLVRFGFLPAVGCVVGSGGLHNALRPWHTMRVRNLAWQLFRTHVFDLTSQHVLIFYFLVIDRRDCTSTQSVIWKRYHQWRHITSYTVSGCSPVAVRAASMPGWSLLPRTAFTISLSSMSASMTK